MSTKHTRSVWDCEKKEYILVPDHKKERYVSIRHGAVLFDFGFMMDRTLMMTQWPILEARGTVIYRGQVVIEDEDLPQVIEVLQERLEHYLSSIESEQSTNSGA